MDGPSAFTTARGRRRHSPIKARYLGFDGLFCGTRMTLAEAYIRSAMVAAQSPSFVLKSNEPVPRFERP